MALTLTPEADLGFFCPDFHLPSVDGRVYSRKDFERARVLVVMFLCNHCPYVKAIEDRILQLGRDYENGPVRFLAICSNDPSDYQEDSFENLKKRWTEKSYPFPYLHDEDQSVARAFDAVCTPDFFVFNDQHKLIYRGRLDDNWKSPEKVTREDLRLAIENELEGGRPLEKTHPSMGCSIKWKEEPT